MKENGIVMENDAKAIAATKSAQDDIRKYLYAKYGKLIVNPNDDFLMVKMKLKFQKSMPDFETNGPEGIIIIHLAPIDLLPYSVFYFLNIIEHFESGAFFRNDFHVKQSFIKLNKTDPSYPHSLAWQEYHPDYPHKKYTLGYAGRPGGPGFYISTVDNTQNHGPGSQGSKTEADSCFGKIVDDLSLKVVERMGKQPGGSGEHKFVNEHDHQIIIESLTIINTAHENSK